MPDQQPPVGGPAGSRSEMFVSVTISDWNWGFVSGDQSLITSGLVIESAGGVYLYFKQWWNLCVS